MRAARWATISIQPIAVCVAMSAMLAASVAHGSCCVCQGTNQTGCDTNRPPFFPGCTNCALTCAIFGGTMRSCSDAVASCEGIADDCRGDDIICFQTQTGSGSCDTPTPTGTATATGTVTNTATATSTGTVTHTPTNTPTATPTNTGIPIGGDCATPSVCASGFCVDGVCCNTACNDAFGRCDLPGQRGTCAGISPAPALTPRALAIAAVLLLGVAAFALRRRVVRH